MQWQGTAYELSDPLTFVPIGTGALDVASYEAISTTVTPVATLNLGRGNADTTNDRAGSPLQQL